MSEYILDLLMITIPAFIVFLTAYFVIRSFMKNETRMKQLELRHSFQKEAIPLKLHAYERLALFLERIDFNNMIQRLRRPEMTAKELQYELISNIRIEYEHNLSQQIYVSAELWNMITFSKDELIKMINMLAASLPPNSTGTHLGKALFELSMESESPMPTKKVLNALRDEVKDIF